MAEIVKVVQQREAEGYECQMCNWAWIPKRNRKPPRRCPNHCCRSVRWDAQKYPLAGPPRPPGGGAFDNSGEGLPRTCYQTLPLTARKPATPVVSNPPRHQAVAA